MVLCGVIGSYAPEGYGTVIVKGDPYPFTLERMWQSPVLPQVGMQVNVTFSPEVGIASIVVQESQPQAAPPAPPLPGAYTPPARPVSSLPTAGYAFTPQAPPPPLGAVALGQGLAPAADPNQAMIEMGGRIAAVAVLALAWMVLPLITINLGFLGQLKVTFWQIIGHFDALSALETLRSESALGMGLQLLAIASLAAALLPLMLKQRIARLGGLAPLVVMGVALLAVVIEVQRIRRATEGFLGADLGGGIASEAGRMVHFGLGGFLAILVALALAGEAIWKFTSSRD